MRVLFIKDAQGGKKGQIKDVADGYAQNFLIPRGFAAVATPQIVARMEKEAKETEFKHQKELEKLRVLKANMEKREFAIKVKVGDKGQVFGGVHEKQIAEAVSSKLSVEIDPRKVETASVIKALGSHQAKVNLGNGIIANININITAE
ncbi:MAG: 50S ribosomal protein L9 [Candidatus Doudnabacteria bacterium]|nr:50S ribosomal protein L9 [Candidatus Doudnabacteria bacterium]